jgi:hypothetical protein
MEPTVNTPVAARLLYDELHREREQLRQQLALQQEATALQEAVALNAQRAATTLAAELGEQLLALKLEVATSGEALVAAARRDKAKSHRLEELEHALRVSQTQLEGARKEARAEAAAREAALREALQATREAVRIRYPFGPTRDVHHASQ